MNSTKQMRTKYIILLISSSCMVFSPPASAEGPPAPAAEQATQQIYISMHSSPIDDYCAPCIASEQMLKAANLQYRKILEPLGPWPWFKFTDQKGNQTQLRGGLTEADIEKLKKGELPGR
jgi:hypothetical protein